METYRQWAEQAKFCTALMPNCNRRSGSKYSIRTKLLCKIFFTRQSFDSMYINFYNKLQDKVNSLDVQITQAT